MKPTRASADFNDAGRHSHVTGTDRAGASIMEAKELARHADIRQTAKYTHIGMRARAEALAGLQYPKTCEIVALSEIRRVSGGVLRQEVSRLTVTATAGGFRKRENPFSGRGFVVSCRRLSGTCQLTQVMEAAGIAPASPL